MDPHGFRELLAGAGCAACGGRVPLGRIRILAQRDDLAFAELSCRRCGTVGLAIAVTSGNEATLDGSSHPELQAGDEARLGDGRPIGASDVAAMREFLAGWHGDLRSLLDGSAR